MSNLRIALMALPLAVMGCSRSGDETTGQPTPEWRPVPLVMARQDPRCREEATPLHAHGGVVNSSGAAKTIAWTYMVTFYPYPWVRNELPLEARLHNGVWHVSGTLPEGSAGGVAELEICQSNGRVLEVRHGQ